MMSKIFFMGSSRPGLSSSVLHHLQISLYFFSPSNIMSGDGETHEVFVYGTLKKGFHNYEHVLRGKETADATVRPYGGSGLEPPYGRTVEQGSGPAAEEGEAAPQQVEAVINEVRGTLFVDRYYIPYLQLSETNKTRVRGEIYTVSSSMLAILDELEGVGKGRYKRSRVSVEVRSEREATPATVVPCWIYHLDEGVEIDVDIDQNAEANMDLSVAQLRGTTAEQASGKLYAIGEYRLDQHRQLYVPPGVGREQKFYRTWGGYC